MSRTRTLIALVAFASLPTLAPAQERTHRGIIIGTPRVDGIRVVFRDHGFERVHGANISVWNARSGAELGEVQGVALGLPMSAVGDLHGIGIGVLGVGAQGGTRGLALGGVGAGAGGSMRGLALGGIGVGAGGELRGIAAGGIGVGSGGGIRGIAVGGVGVGTGGSGRMATTLAATRAFSSSVSPGTGTKVPVDWSAAILAASFSGLPSVSMR